MLLLLSIGNIGGRMKDTAWFQGFPGAIMVTDAKGIIMAMNEQASRAFEKEGGYDLIGKNVLDCHPEPARSKLENLFKSPRKNVYTIQKHGKKRLVYQAPYFTDGQFAGLIELGLDLPEEIPHFNRDL
jgi:transcriptional regulator with PAS, ATPase and Fis domain